MGRQSSKGLPSFILNIMYAELAIPKTGFKTFTYKIPEELRRSIAVGSVVLIPFGRYYSTGIVIGLTATSNISEHRLKKIIGLIDPVYSLTDSQSSLLNWIADYYMSPLGDVLKAAFPPRLLGRTKTRVVAGEKSPEDPKWRYVYEKIEARENGYPFKHQGQIIAGIAGSLIKKMISSGVLYLVPDFKIQKARDKIYVQLTDNINIAELLPDLTARQRELLDYLISYPEGLAVNKLIANGFSRQLIRKLADDQIINLTKKSDDIIVQPRHDRQNNITANEKQRQAIETICQSLEKGLKKSFLLFGVTGSGKTLVYIEAARKALQSGKSVLIMLPEISLTPQAVDRFSSSLDEPIGVWHSRITPGQRHEIYRKAKTGELKVVLGVRSAVFSPLMNLGLIVIDEEQDDSYKQSEPPPYYNARDVALMRAKIEGATAVLGSATPSLESYFNAEQGKYELLTLPERYGGAKMPKAFAIDLRNTEIDQKLWPLSEPFIERICTHIADGKQVIILLNRRGYSGLLICKSCGWVALCPECKVALTYHKKDKGLHCHFCGYTEKAPGICPQCKGNEFDYRGIGTQKLEELIAGILGERGIIRMDSDSTSRKGTLEKIISTFEVGEKPILLGTRMVAKGHHFPKVGMVAVVLADAGLHLPDFRASEKVFQLLVQAAGRAGRTGNSLDQGEFVVQSYDPSSGILDYATSQNYEIFYRRELAFRQELGYPPFGKIIRLVFSGDDYSLTRWAAKKAVSILKKELRHGKVLGPAVTGVFRLRNKYHYQVMLKGSFSADFKKRLRIHLEAGHFGQAKGVSVKVDVDPREMV